MLIKSYQVENNINLLKNKITLFYGENLGLINDLKDKIINENRHNIILKFTEDQILSKQEDFYIETNHNSLFEKTKIIIISNASDKIIKLVEDLVVKDNDAKVYIFTNILEKKSKLRSFFEKEKKLDIVPCYNDGELSLKNIIWQNFKDFRGVDSKLVDLLINTANNRYKLKNEIKKIKTFFVDKKIEIEKVKALLNIQEAENFNIIKDYALGGNIKEINELLSTSWLEADKNILYLNIINQRLAKLKQIINNNPVNKEKSLDEIKPPIFWKDKPIFLLHLKKWNKLKLATAFNKTFETEVMLKTNSYLNSKTIMKKLILDICNLANAA